VLVHRQRRGCDTIRGVCWVCSGTVKTTHRVPRWCLLVASGAHPAHEIWSTPCPYPRGPRGTPLGAAMRCRGSVWIGSSHFACVEGGGGNDTQPELHHFTTHAQVLEEVSSRMVASPATLCLVRKGCEGSVAPAVIYNATTRHDRSIIEKLRNMMVSVTSLWAFYSTGMCP
jgi:hypothetical protein